MLCIMQQLKISLLQCEVEIEHSLLMEDLLDVAHAPFTHKVL